ncbi:MAG TPA: MmgE/PrpD family protein [Burkholderiales bacterium]|jgi:2-methylcitrate dehydratase PrpD|nr:MmgE/PrpD family protein [Burkholderiales bacterium]
MNDQSAVRVERNSAATLSGQLAYHAAGTHFDAIPPAALDAAKLFMLDTLAVAWAGSDAPGCRETHALLVDEGGRADGTAWVYGGRLPATSAAFINGMSASALDFDSIGQGAAVHINIAVLPAALAIAQKEHACGRDFLAALVIGADIVYRLGVAAKYPNRGFHYTGTFGVFGAAAAAGRLLGLDAEAMQHALGLGFFQAAGTQQANIQPSLAKRMLSAFAARSGVYAALLAQRGLTAPSEVLEGKFGFYALYQEGDPDRLTEALGRRFDGVNVSLKKYPSCGCNHTTIEAMLNLIRRYDLRPDDVQSVEVTVTPYIDRIVGGRYDPSHDPQVAAQFNLRYTVACLLVRRKLGLAEIQEDVARDPAIAAQIAKVSVKVDPQHTTQRGPIVVRVQSRTHGEISCRVEDVRGGPDDPFTPAEIDEKFDECFRRGARPLDSAQIALLTQRVREVEAQSDMAAFFDGIC